VTERGDAAAALRAALPEGWGLRERTDADLPFLGALYAQVREDELRPVPWTPEQKRAFLHDQFAKQHAHYLAHYPHAQWWVITEGDVPMGRLYLEQTPRDLRVMDISLVSLRRGRGIGSALMRALLQHAEGAGLPVSLHVEPFNPALRLYERLGFSRIETRGIYLFMRRDPPALS
jgi:ribosomal protein S18 acetylase RimI-like enzyme